MTRGRRSTIRRRYGRTIVASSVLATALAVVGSISPAFAQTVTNYNGNGLSNPIGMAVGPDGALWFTNFANGWIGRISTWGR